MATFTNTTVSNDLGLALGSPSLTENDLVGLIEGASDYNAGLDSIGGTNLSHFYALPTWTGSMGGSSGRLELDADLVEIRFGGREFWLTGTAAIPRLVYEPNLSSAILNLDSITITHTEVSRGAVVVNGTANPGTVTAFGNGSNVTIDVESGGTAVTAANLGARASMATRRNVTNATLGLGARLTCDENTKVTGTVTLEGGVYEQVGSAGDVTVDVGAAGGTVDVSGVTAATTVTVTGRGRAPVVMVPASGLVTLVQSGFNGDPVLPVPAGIA